ncbi:hypothetical protein CMUS01_05863 [Colletotrichum musicola]|uniref:Uncharacterized protein n=1 Tax=Colletotrichum musicola TaxID=2175873 RepID=A0A8H6KP90_9PEZI|nr:hypothetical protein CMUS01_05863 [Colletotrichum musicola]
MSPFSRKKGARSEVPVGAKDGDSKMATLQPKDGKDTNNNGSLVSDAKDIRHDRIVYDSDGRPRRTEKKEKNGELKGWKATIAKPHLILRSIGSNASYGHHFPRSLPFLVETGPSKTGKSLATALLSE